MAMDASFADTTNLVGHQVRSIQGLPGTCSDENQICTRLILNALQTLCVPPSVCLSVSDDGHSTRHGTDASNAQTRRMDDTLRTNRRVLETISRVLQCSCSVIPSVQLLLVVACDRVVAWYRAMLRDDEIRTIHEQVHFASSSSIDHDQCELVLATPITIGDFTVDTAMQVHIRNQLVIDEMRRVQNTVHQFAARVHEAQCQSSPAHRRQIYEVLNYMLRDQLHAQANMIHERIDV